MNLKRVILSAQAFAVLATILLVAEFWLSLRQPWVILLSVLGVIWYSGQHWRIVWIDAIMLAVYTLTAALIIPAEGSPFLSLGVILASLSSWQLANFSRRLMFVQDPVVETRLFNRHLNRLLAILLLSLFLCTTALIIKIELRFWILLGVGLLVIIGLSQIVSFLNRQGN